MNISPKKLLFVAAASGEGQFRQIVDPALSGWLEKEGFRCRSCFLPQLREEHLREASALVIVRTPMPGHAQDDSGLFRNWTPKILEAVKKGMGLAIFFSESYGRSEGTLEEFTLPLGLRCYFNQITEHDPLRRSLVPNLDGGDTVLAEASGIDGIPELEVVIGGGHGTQQLTCETDSNWRTLLRGSKTCRSEAFPAGFYSHGSVRPVERPVFAAERGWGEGRIVAFPGSAPLWIASGFLARFEGHLLRQRENAGFRFLRWIFTRIARHAPSSREALETLTEEEALNRAFSFRYVGKEEQGQLQKMKPFRIFAGTLPDGMTPEQLAAEAVEAGCAAAVRIEDYDSLTLELWRARLEEYSRIPGIDLLPGYEQIDGEGNASVVFSVDDLPDQRKHYPNSNLLEDLLVKRSGYAAVYARPEANRYPCWRQGGYNLIEFDGPASLSMFREKVASVSSLGIMTVNRGTSPKQEKYHTYVLAPERKDWRRFLTENYHFTFVASGSVQLERFGLFGPSLMLDDWEGYWYEWETGETAELSLALSSDVPFAEVTVWNGDRIFRRFAPNKKTFEYSEILEFTEDLRLTVSARCADGSELVSGFPVYTRNRHFWAHVGSDQMNDYHNVFAESPNGMMGIGNRFYEPYGFVTCGFAWGDYVRLTPPVPWSDLMPSGIEVSSMTSNFKSFHPSPFVRKEDGSADFLNHHHRKLGRCNADTHSVHTDASGMWLEQPGAVWRGHGGREFHPTRAIVPSRLWQCRGEYEIPKWKPYEPVRVNFHLKLCFLRNFRLPDKGRIIIGESIHMKKKGLLLNGIPLEKILLPGAEVPADWKEWDNLNAFELFRRNPGCGGEVKLEEMLSVTGDPCGTYRFYPPQKTAGKWFFRVWNWRNDGFLLSYEWEPDHDEFELGEIIPLEYRISLEAFGRKGEAV